MNYQREDIDKNNAKFTVTVDRKAINASHSKAVKSLGKDVKVPGFRKGHVPMEVLEHAIDPARLGQVEVNDAINQAIVELIESEDLQLLDQPVVTVTKYVPNDTLEFTAEIKVVPPAKLGDPTKLGVKKPKVVVPSQRVDEVVERLRVNAAKRKSVDRAAKNGDEVVIDFTGFKDGEEFEGGKAKDYQLELGSAAFIPGFEDGIVGHKPGDKFDVDVTFPEDYGAKNLAGMKATFKIDLKKVNELELPELNDEFAKSFAPDLATMDALRKDINDELVRQEEADAREKYYSELLDKLADNSEVDVPQVLVDDQVPQMKQQFSQSLMYRGMDLNSYLEQMGKDEQQWEKEDLRPSAEKRIRNSLVLRQFIKQYGIEVSEADLDEYQGKIVSRYNNPKMQANFRTPEARRRMREQLLMDRANTKLAELNEKK